VTIIDGFAHQTPDTDPVETGEWLEAFDGLLDARGEARARFLLIKLLERARERQVGFPATVSTHYVNTIPPSAEPAFPGDEAMERRIRAFIRWNAAAMVVRANAAHPGLGGHLATFASSAALYDVGFNHFFRGPDEDGTGDLISFQGHAAPGVYARAYLEGRLTEEHLDRFRRELGGDGLSSYPHPRLMPEFWEFPTVSMGLGPLAAIYQARFNRYLHNRGLKDTSKNKVWCFLGDGECDEPESLGSLSLAAREGLDNLIFVVNCNLQRLDGPVRGNGKIIQELEAVFRGAGWNVIKVIWGQKWDKLLARDDDGLLVAKMDATVDGEYQRYAVAPGSYTREHFFGPDPRLRAMVDGLTDEEIRSLPRGGHDYLKLYAAYAAATAHTGAPTVILAKTIKGWTLGADIEARNVTHQVKTMNLKQLNLLRERLDVGAEIGEITDDDIPPYFRPAEGSPEHEYLMERRRALGGVMPRRRSRHVPLPAADVEPFEELAKGSRGREVSTTMAFASLLRGLLRDEQIGERVVPIIPDEARTFGMDPLFSEFKIYAAHGQLYEPVDAEMLLAYRESKQGQILEEGITEAGSMCSMQAAGTAHASHGVPMIPFFIYYSMFGFQRIGDLVWQFGDARGRGFLCGGTAGRTTLNGEGLQHQDGHSLLLASAIPNLRAYDPAFAYEVGWIVQDGIRAMFEDGEDCFYYLTLYNENYVMPEAPSDPQIREDALRGIYRFADAPEGGTHEAAIIFSGTAWRAAVEARDALASRYDVGATLFSATSYKALRDEAREVDRQNRLHPAAEKRVPFITSMLPDLPTVAVSDFVSAVPDQVARWIPGRFLPLGTDGYGRSDTREALRRHFEIDAGHIVVATLYALGAHDEAAQAIKDYQIDADAIDPLRA
jgi:pyruvate dehydrogenase E1 component